MFLLRTAFWLGLVIAFIPVNPEDLKEGQRPVSPLETIGLAKTVVSDVASFCERNTQSCETGGQLFSQIGVKAREGARIAYTWLDERYGEDAESKTAGKNAVDPVSTGAVK